MLIYEKNNKLNINFDNEISENPDLQIGKEDGKTEVLVDGQPSGGGGGNVLIIGTTGPMPGDPTIYLDKTWSEINEVLANGGVAYIHWTNFGYGNLCPGYYMVTGACVYSEGEQYNVYVIGDIFSASSESEYPFSNYD